MPEVTTKRKLPCKLNHREIKAAAMSSALKSSEYDAVEAAKKLADANYNRQLKMLRTETSTSSKKALTGLEERIIECVWMLDRLMGRATLRRVDTGEVVESRQLEEREMQIDMSELDELWSKDPAPAGLPQDEDDYEPGEDEN